jgi:hypothetical protein
LVARLFWEQEVASSNLAAPTISRFGRKCLAIHNIQSNAIELPHIWWVICPILDHFEHFEPAWRLPVATVPRLPQFTGAPDFARPAQAVCERLAGRA